MRRLAWLLVLTAGCSGPVDPVPPRAAPTTLVVMTFNAWGAGSNQGKSIDETAAVIKAIDPDIVGLQETRAEGDPCDAYRCDASGPSAAPALAEALGYHVFEQAPRNEALWSNAILSRYPITQATEHGLGVSIDVAGRQVFAFNVHFTDFPYQPFQLLGIAYADAPFLETEAEAIAAAVAARGSAVELLLKELDAARDADAAFIFGDFNEPSFRDWTTRAARQGAHPIAVRYPATRAIEAAGFTDLYRAVFADELLKPGFTWTPMSDPKDPGDHHDRIDYVFAKAPSLEVLSAGVVGEKPGVADIVITPWPSDHRAVVATVAF